MTYLLAGLRLITRPGLRLFVIIPLTINILLFISLFVAAKHFMAKFNHWFLHFLPHWLQWLNTVLWFLFFVSFFLFLVYTFVILANIISAPFNSFLAEKIEYHLTGKILTQRSLWDNIKDIPRIVGRQLALFAYYLPRAALLLLLFFVPMVQLIAPILWFVFHAWFMTLTYIDYPTDNHRIPLIEVHAWLWQRRWQALSLGISVLVMSMVPGLNLVVIPAAVAGATQFWIKESCVK